MAFIDRAIDANGMTVEDDVPVAGQRRLKYWRRLVGTARKLESDEAEIQLRETRLTRKLQDENLKLQKQNFDLQKRIVEYELKERCSKINLPDDDLKFLLSGPSDEIEEAKQIEATVA